MPAHEVRCRPCCYACPGKVAIRRPDIRVYAPSERQHIRIVNRAVSAREDLTSRYQPAHVCCMRTTLTIGDNVAAMRERLRRDRDTSPQDLIMRHCAAICSWSPPATSEARAFRFIAADPTSDEILLPSHQPATQRQQCYRAVPCPPACRRLPPSRRASC